ncbi:amino acid ABC transporter ATP-binding protein [Aminobacter sp. NyZ550]|jgi:ABC-type polar amino acid transport system ATPase subunit|uniref:Amino acid ABC transporter ATP-binding protein n=2 Tax=Aminobacter TaxID=31988 RepID=A0AAC8YIX8_AMIAI|nr:MULTISPECIES: amino acid ABC transporter ATP-binding protein [Aminobacter]AMS39162.1 amino acid ABC transporter ATP-binding protein [Aminobacter aminovorans]MBA8905159.1 polar amino acid transport system ATP-binding protein [Aminobacter ciceronei]MBA9018979.1 polar amino acid transport system ATP-binding protein [Aminobacter ciceronei]MBB3706993.1 polar amino acid transport system ATP-binding protein [Aminobacter aminovorans]MRX32695.1 ATP-binding cassette domain-containing protein [Aminoba
MISITGLRKSFGAATVLNGIDLEIRQGEVVSVLGSSGSGKSTLIRCINGLEKIDAGKITVDNFDVSKPRELAEARKRSGTVFQLFNLYPHMTAVQNVALAPVEVLKVPRKQAEAEARELLNSVGLSERADAYPSQLSGGQRQRVGICRALAMKPSYLLLDEVTSALDPEMTSEVLSILANLAKGGTTMVFVTHEIEFARSISSRIAFLDKGQLIADLPTEDFFSATGMALPRVAQFLSKMRKD